MSIVKQYEKQGVNITFKAGIAGMKANRLVHIDQANGIVNYSHLENKVNGILVSSSVDIGDAVTVKLLPNFQGSFDIAVLDTGARGAVLYLDIHTNQADATGLCKFAIGTSFKELAIANNASVGANFPLNIAAYQTNEINNIEINA